MSLRLSVIVFLCLPALGQATYSGAGAFWGSAAYGAVQGPSLPALPNIWVDNNEALDGVNCGGYCSGIGYVAPAYELQLSHAATCSSGTPCGTWIAGPPAQWATCSTHNYLYDTTATGKEYAKADMEACRTYGLSHSTQNCAILDVPPGTYSTTNGVVIPQTSNALATCFNVIRSTAYATLAAMPQPVCAGGIQDNLPTSTNPGMDNPDCTGTNMYFALGVSNSSGVITGITTVSANTTTLAAITASGSPQLVPLTNDYISPTLAPGSGCITIDTECVVPQSGVNQTGLYAIFTQNHASGATVTYVPNANGNPVGCTGPGSFALANGTCTNISAYNYLQYMYQDVCTGHGCIPFALCAPIATDANSCGGTTQIGPDHWLFEDDAASRVVGDDGDNYIFSTGTSTSNVTAITQYASHIHFRRDWAHGDWTSLASGANKVTDGFLMKSCTYCSIVDSQLSLALRPGGEGHGVGAGGNTLKIVHNSFEGESSCVFSGGESWTSAITPAGSYVRATDAQIGRNRCTFPYSWIGINHIPTGRWAGQSLVRKNANEMKEGKRILVYGSIFENSDNSGGQRGQMGNFGPNLPAGNGYQATLTDITVENLIVRNGCRDMEIGARSSSTGGVSDPMQRIWLNNILHYNTSQTNPNCPGSGDPGVVLGPHGQEMWIGTVTQTTSTTATFVAIAPLQLGATAISVIPNDPSAGNATYILNGPTSNGDSTLCGGANGEAILTSGFTNSGNNSSVSGYSCVSSDNALSTLGTMTSGSGILTASDAPFMSSMVGAGITVSGAGASNKLLTSTVASYQSATQVTLADTAGTSVSSATVTMNSLVLSNSSAVAEGPINPTGSNALPVLNGSSASTNATLGFQELGMPTGSPVSMTQCANIPAFNVPTVLKGGVPTPIGIGPLTSTGSAPWDTTSPNAANITVVYPWPPPGQPAITVGTSDSTCQLTNVEGYPINAKITHNTIVTDATSPLGSGPNGNAPTFMLNPLFQDDIFITGPLSRTRGGWFNAAVSGTSEGFLTENFDYDAGATGTSGVGTTTADHLIWPERDTTLYTAYGNNPSFPVPSPVLFFPLTDYCTGTTPDPYTGPGTGCVGFVGAMSASSMPLLLTDYHGFALRVDSPFHNAASDGTDIGAKIPAIDAAQTTNLYVCGSSCGSPGPFPD